MALVDISELEKLLFGDIPRNPCHPDNGGVLPYCRVCGSMVEPKLPCEAGPGCPHRVLGVLNTPGVTTSAGASPLTAEDLIGAARALEKM